MNQAIDPRPTISKLSVYIPGRRIQEVERDLGLANVVKLASNENPLGPSPLALAAAQAALAEVHLYPDNSQHELKRALAERLKVRPECVAVGAGGTHLLKLTAEAYLRPGDRVVYPAPSFPLYSYCAQLMDAVPVPVPLAAGGVHDLDAMAVAAAGARLVFLCNPNNPTGRYFSAADVERFLDRVPPETLVVLDEAYFEYAQAAAADYPDGVELVRRGRSLLVLRTLSKVYGLAGLRVAYMVGPPALAESIRLVCEPFAVGSVAQAAALAALDDREHLAHTLRLAASSRDGLAGIAASLNLQCLPSVANFVYIHVGSEAVAVSDALMGLGVIVRPSPPPSPWIRVTVGSAAENARFGDALAAVLGGRPRA